MHQSVPAALMALAFFWPWEAISPWWGWKKTILNHSLVAQWSKAWNTDFSQVERSDDQKYVCVRRLKPSGAMFKHFQCVFFFILANICLYNSAILIKASYAATPVYDSYYIIRICLVLKRLKVKKKMINSMLQSYLFWIINLVHTCNKTILWHEHNGTRRWLRHYVCSAKMLIKQHFNNI